MLSDIKLIISQLAKIIQSAQFLGITLGNMMSNLDKKALWDLAVPLTKDVWSKLASKATSSTIDTFERKISRKGAIRERKGFTLFISNKDMDDIIIGCFTDSAYVFFIDTACGFFIDKSYIWKRSHESRKRIRRWNSLVIAITFNDESLGKRSRGLEN